MPTVSFVVPDPLRSLVARDSRQTDRRALFRCTQILDLISLRHNSLVGKPLRRRDLIVGIAGSAAAWPLAVRAQQASGMRRIGVFTGAASSNPEVQARYAAFLQALQNLGWIEGHNLKVDYRFGTGNVDDTRKYVAALVAL